MDIQEYMTQGVNRVVKDSIRAVFSNPRQSAFMAQFAIACAKASRQRASQEKEGFHVPPFLIASITSACNLHCAGCYSRFNHATVDAEPVRQLSSVEWQKIFQEAKDIGVSFILLAGGEPLLRRDILRKAAGIPEIIFPVFTNGTYIDEEYFALFDAHRNLIPVLSIEGGKETTDERRGEGVYDKIASNMNECKERGLIFGASITVTTENYQEVTSKEFARFMADKGCRLIIFVEFVPVTDEAKHLAPSQMERDYMANAIEERRNDVEDIVFVSFPGDEKSSDGCIAAGRGFFHINSHGGAEPCPFSPYSDINVRDTSLKEALQSKLFKELQDGGYLLDDHEGGCVLFEKREAVEALMK